MVSGVRETIVSVINRRFFYGWTIVGLASLGIFTSGPGQSHTATRASRPADTSERPSGMNFNDWIGPTWDAGKPTETHV